MKHILVVLSDQQRWDSLGCYGGHNCTPFLDSLAGEGTRFQYAFTPQPVCGPARSCIQTGLYAAQTGCFRNDVPLKEDAVTLAKLFRDQGYATGYIGKWHLASSLEHGEDFIRYPPPARRMGGYEKWTASDALELTSDGYGGYLFDHTGKKAEFSSYRVDGVNRLALDFLDSWNKEGRREGKPFLLFVSFIEPHQQNSTDTVQGPPDAQPGIRFPIPGDLLPGQGNWEQNIDAYMQCARRIDQAVEDLAGKLKQLGVYEQTLIVYTSDHGCHFKTRGPEYKRTCHDASIRIPFVIRGGKFLGGEVRQDFASLIDLMPTLAGYAGIPLPSPTAGKDLSLPLGTSGSDDCVYVQISEQSLSRAVRTREYCYCVTNPYADPIAQSSSLHYEDAYLYDMRTDLHQQDNLIHNCGYRQVKLQLRNLLRRKAREANEWIETIADSGEMDEPVR